VRRDGEMVIFNMVASSFLPHQVRNTVGALIRVGLGKMSCDEFYSIIEARKPGLAGPMAPAGGLYLTQVNFSHPFEEETA
jgi:tRNA pseudouridine38-40 synthase